jgi:hypothetical protein
MVTTERCEFCMKINHKPTCCVHFNIYSSCCAQNLEFVSDLLRVLTNEICVKKWTLNYVFLLWAETPQDSNPGGGSRVSLLHTCPSRLSLVPSWSPVCRVLALGVKWPWRSDDHSPAPSTKFKNG